MKEISIDNLKHRLKGSSTVQILIDDKSIIGKSKELVISLLGSSNWIYHTEKN